MIIALATQKMWKIHQMDVKSTNYWYIGEKKKIFIEQLPRHVLRKDEKQVYKLKENTV